MIAVVLAAVAVMVVALFSLARMGPLGGPVWVVAVLALDVGLNDLVLGRAVRRLAVEEARATFRVGRGG